MGRGLLSLYLRFAFSFINVWLGCSNKILILAFLGKYSNIVCWVSKCVCWESHHLVSELLGSKIRFTILLPFVSCYHSIFFRLCSLFLVLCFVLCTKLKKRKEKVILKHQVEKKRWYWSNRYYHSIFSKLVYSWIETFVVSVLSKKKIWFFFFSSLISCSLIYFLPSVLV